MRATALFYLAGIVVALAAPLPIGAAVLAWALPATLAACLLPRLRLPALFVAGLLCGGSHVAAWLAAHGALAGRGEVVRLAGRVADFGTAGARGWSFELSPAALPRSPAAAGFRPRVRLAGWRAAAPPAPGAWCVLHARLRRVHAPANRALADRERALVARHVVALGSVIEHPANLCEPLAPRHAWSSMRTRLGEAIAAGVVDSRGAAVIRALAIGDRSALDDHQWQRARDTGTAHLLAISGLHVSLAAGWAFLLVRWSCAPLALAAGCRPLQRAAWAGALGAAVAYALLAGFGIPARRAACMVAFAALAALGGRRALSLDNLALALVVLATLDPLSLLSAGCWLSFAAAGVLVAVSARPAAAQGRLRGAWRTHLVLAAGLAPLTAFAFGSVAPAAPLANLVAVPWCSLLVVPASLLGVLVAAYDPGLAALPWDMASRLWLLLAAALDALAKVAPGFMPGKFGDGAAVVLLSAALGCVAAPRALGLRCLALLLALAAGLPRERALEAGEMRVEMLDVGQGLAVVVRTRRHTLLYDTGPAWWGVPGDAGAAIVVPALARAGVTRLDAIVVSHVDSDHAGGLQAVRAAFPDTPVYAPAASAEALSALPCAGTRPWRWDGVALRWLSSARTAPTSRNDGSCVLSVASRYGRVLLPGDIERDSERALLADRPGALRAEVVIVPHHGSRTSSTTDFVAAVAPRVALVAAGHRNRYGQPHAEVLARYRAQGAQVCVTAVSGAIDVALGRDGLRVDSERARRHGFWSRVGDGAGACRATFGG